MVAAELRESGLPVTTVPAGAGEMYPTQLLELWLEDESLLEDESVRQRISEAIDAHPLTESDAETIDEMPVQDSIPAAPSFETARKSALWPAMLALFLLIVAVLTAMWLSNWP